MTTAASIFEGLMDAFMLVTVVLYIQCQIVLYWMIKRGSKEKLATYFYLVYFCGKIC